MEVKKIVIVNFELLGIGGMEVVFNKFNSLLKMYYPNIQLSIILLREKNICINEDWHKDLDTKYIDCKIRNHKLRRFLLSYKLSRILRDEKPDIILTADIIGCYVADLATKLLFKKIPIYSWNHTSLWAAYKPIYVLKAHYHIPISSGNRDFLLKHGVSKDNIRIVYNPIEPVIHVIRRPTEKIKFLFSGRVLAKDSKNLEFMFNTLSELEGNWELHIIGDGEDKEYLIQLSENLGIKNNIIFHGWQNEPWDYVINNIGEITAFLLTSVQEGLPMVLVEAISYGIYSISSDCLTGPIDIINDNNGRLFPVNDKEALLTILTDIVNKKYTLPDNETIKNTAKKFHSDVYIKNMMDFFRAKSKDAR